MSTTLVPFDGAPVQADAVLDTLKSAAEPTEADVSQDAAAGNVSVDMATIDIASSAGELEGDLKTALRGVTGTVKTLRVEDEIIIQPPAMPEMLYNIFKLSAYLLPDIEALLVNVYETGVTFDSPLNLNDPDDIAKLAWLLDLSGQPSDTASIDAIKREIAVEKLRIASWFESLNTEGSQLELLSETGMELEVTGNAYWEILRDSTGSVVRAKRIPSVSMRATVQGAYEVAFEQPVRTSPISWGTTVNTRRFRKYVQVLDGSILAKFKEFGDPRVMSRLSGKYYADLRTLQTDRQEVRSAKSKGYKLPLAATEILHFRVPYTGSPVYGMPDWVGNYPGLVGSRNLDEENLTVVSDSAVPSMMLLVSGGRLNGEDWKNFKNQLENRKPGRKQLMLLQASSESKNITGPTVTPTIKVEKTKSEQTSDALFQNYDVRNETKTDAAFRLPRAALGKDATGKATEAMLRFANDQVFFPKQVRFADRINSTLLPAIGTRWHSLKLAARQPKDPTTISNITAQQMEAGTITPNEAREIVGPIFGKRLKDLPGLWASIPPKLVTSVLQTKNHIAAAALLDETPGAADRLADALRAQLAAGQSAAPTAAMPELPTSDDPSLVEDVLSKPDEE